MRFLTLSLAAAATALLLGAEAAPCDTAKCQFPACVCPSVKPPKGLDPTTVPQFVTLTFDDAIQSQTVPVTSSLMTPHRNPNGCPIKSTWFAQTMYSDFSLIQQWYAAGNEVADHTMTHVGTPPAGKLLLIIPMHAIMDDSNPPKAYSMDVHLSGTPEAVSGWLRNNFNRHYQGTRQPFGIFLHPVHVGNATNLYNEFFSWAVAQKDVWFVTNHQLLEWIKNPVPASELAKQPYMKCGLPAVGKEICNGLDNLKTGGKINEKLLQTCNFPSGPWSTCYGCPKTPPTPADPVPERVDAVGTANYRTPVNLTCAMEWWDPVAAQCLCTSSNCTFTDISVLPTTTSGGVKPTTSTKPNNNNSANVMTGSWSAIGAAAAAAAAIAMQMF
ncbi:hypothetical protein BGW38_008473 [Lunasporangiospora selenospora]|uniref:NodB homology domain-containing protein n=1 Tax=Lunasporangiospora selenospora TaxID=979761 RepID=A0A9P6FYK6_9FUNG|nr:hypothetical protein BGW38_008473 [Lunasporangiospora selenospora]